MSLPPDPIAAPPPRADAEADARGLRCPLPVLRAARALRALPPGAVLRLLTTDPMAEVDVPHFCAEAGHRLLARQADGPRTVWFIARGPERA
jgi:tRNA 2-thiouridine synthesizing protein A